MSERKEIYRVKVKLDGGSPKGQSGLTLFFFCFAESLDSPVGKKVGMPFVFGHIHIPMNESHCYKGNSVYWALSALVPPKCFFQIIPIQSLLSFGRRMHHASGPEKGQNIAQLFRCQGQCIELMGEDHWVINQQALLHVL